MLALEIPAWYFCSSGSKRRPWESLNWNNLESQQKKKKHNKTMSRLYLENLLGVVGFYRALVFRMWYILVGWLLWELPGGTSGVHYTELGFSNEAHCPSLSWCIWRQKTPKFITVLWSGIELGRVGVREVPPQHVIIHMDSLRCI